MNRNIQVTRKDLIKDSEDRPLSEIEVTDIQGGMRRLNRADSIIFIDTNGTKRILKQRS
jgi:hypothetical protein